MNIKEALNLLGLKEGCSDSELKSAFKKKALEYHPDKNKEQGSEDKFKKVNEAYQFLQKNGTKDNYVRVKFRRAADIQDVLRQQMNSVFGYSSIPKTIILPITISLEEAVNGTTRKLKYTVDDQCCNNLQCNVCNGFGVKKIKKEITARIPPGIVNSLILKGQGNYIPTSQTIRGVGGYYGDVSLAVTVVPPDGFTISKRDVISTVRLTLLEALQGTKKEFDTVKGKKKLLFKPKIKNKDVVRVEGFGIPPDGAMIFNIEVDYPDNVEEIIDLLKKEEPLEESKESQQEGEND